MPNQLNEAPTATTIDVEKLARQAWKGAIRVPHFQRDFRWSWEDVRRLFESIVRGYPIGSLLLWQRPGPETALQLGALHIDAPYFEQAFWVVDGQQRVTSIANALDKTGSRDPRFAISYDLRKEEFVKPPVSFDPRIIPLPVLFDLQDLLAWFAGNPGVTDYLDSATSVTKKIRQYEIPAYTVESDDPSILQDIFDRMNNFGKRLNRAEIFSALNAGDENAPDAPRLDTIARQVDADLDFGIIDDETIMAAVLARRGANLKRDVRHEFDKTGDEGIAAAYEATENALRSAAAFLQTTAGVPHYTLVAYRYLIVVLTRFFSHHPDPGPRNIALLKRWYWRAAIVGPEHFKGGTPNAARILCGKINEGDLTGSVQDLLSAVNVERPRRIEARHFATKSASTKILICALWARGPRRLASTPDNQLKTGDLFTTSELGAVLAGSSTIQPAISYVIPRTAIPAKYRGWAATRLLIADDGTSDEQIAQFFFTQPIDLPEPLWEESLQSHFMTLQTRRELERLKFSEFLEERQREIESFFQGFLARNCEWQFESTPPLSSFDLDDDDEADEDEDHGGPLKLDVYVE